MWSERNNIGQDLLIPKISARCLTLKSFQEQYVDKNKPVIITDLSLWANNGIAVEESNSNSNNNAGVMCIDMLSQYIPKEHKLNNVFVSSNNNRFLYFDEKYTHSRHRVRQTKLHKTETKTKTNNTHNIRQAMQWLEFVSRLKKENTYAPLLSKHENYYLYGEPIPSPLIPYIQIPSFLRLLLIAISTKHAPKHSMNSNNDINESNNDSEHKAEAEESPNPETQAHKPRRPNIPNIPNTLNIAILPSLEPTAVTFEEEFLDIDIIDTPVADLDTATLYKRKHKNNNRIFYTDNDNNSDNHNHNNSNTIDVDNDADQSSVHRNTVRLLLSLNADKFILHLQHPKEYQTSLSGNKLKQLRNKYHCLNVEYQHFVDTQVQLLILTLQNMVKSSNFDESNECLDHKQDRFIESVKNKLRIKLTDLRMRYNEYINDLVLIQSLETEISLKHESEQTPGLPTPTPIPIPTETARRRSGSRSNNSQDSNANQPCIVPQRSPSLLTLSQSQTQSSTTALSEPQSDPETETETETETTNTMDTAVADINGDNCMLWISRFGTCSPLHFDLCEGFLCQLSGVKNVILFPMFAEHANADSVSVSDSDSKSIASDSDPLQNFYAYSFDGAHRRQSMIDDIHNIDRSQYPLFASQRGYQGIMCKNEGLYIPIGHWHQIESEANYGSISLSFRWNPYSDSIQNAIRTSESITTPVFIRDCIFHECISQTLPLCVQKLAYIWRDCWRAKIKVSKEMETKMETETEMHENSNSNASVINRKNSNNNHAHANECNTQTNAIRNYARNAENINKVNHNGDAHTRTNNHGRNKKTIKRTAKHHRIISISFGTDSDSDFEFDEEVVYENGNESVSNSEQYKYGCDSIQETAERSVTPLSNTEKMLNFFDID